MTIIEYISVILGSAAGLSVMGLTVVRARAKVKSPHYSEPDRSFPRHVHSIRPFVKQDRSMSVDCQRRQLAEYLTDFREGRSKHTRSLVNGTEWSEDIELIQAGGATEEASAVFITRDVHGPSREQQALAFAESDARRLPTEDQHAAFLASYVRLSGVARTPGRGGWPPPEKDDTEVFDALSLPDEA